MEIKTGIYKLYWESFESLPYIGLSVNIYRRYRDHVKSLIVGNHCNKWLQLGFDMEGTPPIIEVIEECSVENLNKREQFWIDFYNSSNLGLNICSKSSPHNYGENNPMSKHSEDTYINVFMLLVYSNYTLAEISSLTGVSDSIVEDISRLGRHTWLKSRFPEEYSILESKYNNRQDYTRLSRKRDLVFQGKPTANFIHESGRIVKDIRNLSEFARNEGLLQPKLSELLSGNRNTHKGWRVYIPSQE